MGERRRECWIGGQREEQPLFAPGHHLQEALTRLLFRHSDHYTGERGELVHSIPAGRKDMVACLHQARAIDHRRLSSKLGTLDDEDFGRVREGFNRLYK